MKLLRVADAHGTPLFAVWQKCQWPAIESFCEGQQGRLSGLVREEVWFK